MARLKGSSLSKYWLDLLMEAPKEKDAGLSGLGTFFGCSEGTGGGGSVRWDGESVQRQRQAEELAERGIFVGKFAGRAQDQTVGHAP